MYDVNKVEYSQKTYDRAKLCFELNDVFVKVAVAGLNVLFVPRAFTISQDWPA